MGTEKHSKLPRLPGTIRQNEGNTTSRAGRIRGASPRGRARSRSARGATRILGPDRRGEPSPREPRGRGRGTESVGGGGGGGYPGVGIDRSEGDDGTG